MTCSVQVHFDWRQTASVVERGHSRIPPTDDSEKYGKYRDNSPLEIHVFRQLRENNENKRVRSDIQNLALLRHEELASKTTGSCGCSNGSVPS